MMTLPFEVIYTAFTRVLVDKMMKSEMKNTNLKSSVYMYKKVPLQLRGRTVLNQFFAELSDLKAVVLSPLERLDHQKRRQ